MSPFQTFCRQVAAPACIYKKECDPLPLWISTNSSIVEINQSEKKAYILVPTASRAIFFDFHFERKQIYWVEEEEEEVGLWSTRIYRTGLQNINKTEDDELLGDLGPHTVAEMGPCGGVALDWLHSHMYWIHRDTGQIVLASLDGGHRRLIYETRENDIFIIVVDPVRRYLFWTEGLRMKNMTLYSTVDIKASDLRGENTLTIAPSVEVGWARAIALDVTERRLYYIERSTILSMCDYDGRNKVVVRGELPSPPGFTLSSKQLFWSTAVGEVSTVLKHGGGENTFPVELSICRQCSYAEKESMFGLKTYLRVVDGRMQPIPETNHHNFKDCLLNYTKLSEVCPCPFGYKTLDQTQSCKEEGYFVTSFSSEIKAISMKSKTLPLLYKPYRTLGPIDLHIMKGFLFWYDSVESKIYRSPVLNPSQRLTVALKVRGVSGMAVDWIYDHLYWTSNKDGGSVEISKLDGSLRMTVIPRNRANHLVSIAVHPEEGTMYISNWTEGSVEVFGMDGSPKQNLASGLRRPRSLTLSLRSSDKQLFWLESIDYRQRSTTIIKACYLETSEDCRVFFKSQMGYRPSSMTVLLNNIFWLDGTNINYIGINQKPRPRKIPLDKKHLEPHSLKAFHSWVQPQTTNNCRFNSCRGLCIPIPRDFGQLNVRCVHRRQYRPMSHGYATIGL